jgi:protein gp37
MAKRLSGNSRQGDAARHAYRDFRPYFHAGRLSEPLRWRKPRSCFVCSMGDIALAEPEQIAAIFGVIAACPESRFQILTKRPGLLLEWFEWAQCGGFWVGDSAPGGHQATGRFGNSAVKILAPDESDASCWAASRLSGRTPVWPLPNLAIGVSVSTQSDADERIPLLLRIPARWRFVSAEPLLGPVDLWSKAWLEQHWKPGEDGPGTMPLAGVIVGGETGPGARPMHPDWVRSIRDQCAAAGVAFHFKAWGEWVPMTQAPNDMPWEQRDHEDHVHAVTVKMAQCVPEDQLENGCELPGRPWMEVRRVGRKAAGRTLDGRTHDALCWAEEVGL